MLLTLKAARIATVPVPLKFTQAFALPSTTVSTGTDFVPAALVSVFVRNVLMVCFQRKMATLFTTVSPVTFFILTADVVIVVAAPPDVAEATTKAVFAESACEPVTA